MGVPQKALAYIEIGDYLALEDASQTRHEYLDGVIYAIQGEAVQGMAGGSAAHAAVTRNAGFALHAKLRNTPCQALLSGMRLRIAAANAVFYPDVLVHNQPTPNPASTTELTEARLVIEVLSPSTQTFDRGAKLQAYQQLAGLRHIVLLSSTEQAAWACWRGDDDGAWSALAPWDRDASLVLPALGVALTWDDVYGGVGLG